MTNALPENTRPAGKALGPASPYALDDQPGFLLRVALKTHRTVFAAQITGGLTASQFSTLAKLKEIGPCSQNYLGRLIHYDSATITGVINRLKNRGLIQSIVDPLDRRRVTVDLTESGRMITDQAIAAVMGISKETFSPLSSAEHAALTTLLKKVVRR